MKIYFFIAPYIDEEASEVFVVRILHVKRSPDFVRNAIE